MTLISAFVCIIINSNPIISISRDNDKRIPEIFDKIRSIMLITYPQDVTQCCYFLDGKQLIRDKKLACLRIFVEKIYIWVKVRMN